MRNPLERRRLGKLAEAYGVQMQFTDALGKQRRAAPEAVIAVLRELGAPIDGLAGIDAALAWRARERWARPLEPVTVAWAGRPAAFGLRLSSRAPDTIHVEVRTEDGRTLGHAAPVAGLRVLAQAEADGEPYRRLAAALPARLPPGYHRLAVTLGESRFESLLLCAPYRLFGHGERRWAAFAPLYAVHGAGRAAGTYSDLGALMRWVRGLGGLGAATLPLLAQFLRRPFEPSPYNPVSRLLWNELYVDAAAAPEAAGAALAPDPPAQALVDYPALAAARRRNLEDLTARFFGDTTSTARRAAFDAFLARAPAAEPYARFQATAERQGAPWPAWPASLRDAALTPADYDDAAYRYHLYAQWLAAEQIAAAAREARAAGDGLYLDVPLGVHGGGFDTWQHRSLFAHGVSAGAPPDPFFTKGQSWGFPPLLPEASRADGYAHVRAYLQHHLNHAAVLRLDHVMALHRLYWVPAGFGAADGVYVHGHPEEWYALLSLASHRNRAVIVGENLGTVPAAVNDALGAHGLRRMFVLQYEVHPERTPAVAEPAADAVASVNTHDMPPFAAYWNEADVGERLALRLLDDRGADIERSAREAARDAVRAWAGVPASAPLRAVIDAVLARLAASPAGMVLVNLEDLWLAEGAQNTPGTVDERPNWRRRFKLDLETLMADPRIRATLERVARRRTEGGAT